MYILLVVSRNYWQSKQIGISCKFSSYIHDIHTLFFKTETYLSHEHLIFESIFSKSTPAVQSLFCASKRGCIRKILHDKIYEHMKFSRDQIRTRSVVTEFSVLLHSRVGSGLWLSWEHCCLEKQQKWILCQRYQNFR